MISTENLFKAWLVAFLLGLAMLAALIPMLVFAEPTTETIITTEPNGFLDGLLKMIPPMLGALTAFLTRLLMPFMSSLPLAAKQVINAVISIILGAMAGAPLGIPDTMTAGIGAAVGSITTTKAISVTPDPEKKSESGQE